MKKKVGIIFAIGLIATYFVTRSRKDREHVVPQSAPVAAAEQTPAQDIKQKSAAKGPTKLKFRPSEFSDKQKSDFAENFEKKYRPAILKWSNAYHGHLPITPDDVTTDKLAERVGNGGDYNEYVFVVNGATLGVRDSKSEVTVDYLNVRDQTQKLNAIPNGSEAPKVTIPVNQQDILRMIRDDIGTEIASKDVRTTPTGISGGLNGGAVVEVGGDPNNFASWRLNLVFAADGNLAYYLKGPPESP